MDSRIRVINDHTVVISDPNNDYSDQLKIIYSSVTGDQYKDGVWFRTEESPVSVSSKWIFVPFSVLVEALSHVLGSVQEEP